MPVSLANTRNPLEMYAYSEVIPRYCLTCWHPVWLHLGIYPRKHRCRLPYCACGQYYELDRQVDRDLLARARSARIASGLPYLVWEDK